MPSHVAPKRSVLSTRPGELVYSLSHAYGAAFDHPGVAGGCVIGDGEARNRSARGAGMGTGFESRAGRGGAAFCI
ncbi:MAG: hypothetical protein IPM88_20980 [Nitrospira sp.]|nr:hypothetical protein [Nitrospira sp.]